MASSISKEEVVTDIKKITERQKVLFLDILDKECEDYLSVINEKKLKHKETLILLKQSLATIRNAENNLTSFNFVDSYTLLRSGMEYYIMATMIEEDENVFNEFIKITKTGKQLNRTYTKPSQLQKRFSEFLYNNDPNITDEIKPNDIKNTLQGSYDILCKSAHANLNVILYTVMDGAEYKEFLRTLMSMTLYHVKWFLHFVILHFSRKKTKISDEVAFKTYAMQELKLVVLLKINNLDFKKYQQMMYMDTINKKYHEESQAEFEKYKKEFREEKISDEQILKAFESLAKDYMGAAA